MVQTGVRGCWGRGLGVSGVRVNPLNPRIWGKGWGADRREEDAKKLMTKEIKNNGI